ncbi:MAG: hypothetical protein ACT4PT_00300 [Methanobacteriota archaeon]
MAKRRATKRAAKGKKPAGAKRKPAPKRTPERTRVVFPMDVYEPNKDAIKAPLKKLGMKWQYLGRGKGRYFGEDVQAFVQFTDAGADYTVRGAHAKVKKILAAWSAFRTAEHTEAAVAAEEREARDEATRLWELARPVPRPGEPEGFFRRRLAAWEAARPDNKRSANDTQQR